MNIMQKAKTLLIVGLASIFLVGIFSLPVFAQSRAQRNPGVRSAISFPANPQSANSFYPVIRQTSFPQAAQPNQPSWVDLGNGARIRLAEKNFKDENQLSPDVLATLKSLKEAEPKPRYQLGTPITGARPQTLESPRNEPRAEQQEIGVLESRITFPADKNIRIQSLDFRNTSVTDALRSLAQLIRINLMLSPAITGNVTILFSDVTLEEAFNTLLTSYDLSFAWQGNILSIFPKSSAPLLTKIFPVQHTNAADIKSIVDKMLTPQRGSSEIDTRTNSLMVTDTSTKLAEVKSLLPQLDVKESTVDISSRPLTEVFYLDYADAATLLAPIKMLSTGVQIQEFSSSSASQAGAAGGGTTGGRMDMMIISDTQNNLQRIRELVDKLDVPPIQVTIDAHIYEIDKNEEERVGINWQKSIPISGTAENLFEMTVAPEDATAGGTGVFRFGSLDINQFTALLAMLKTHSFAKVLSNPVITTLNNREATITVGQAIPYVSASTVNATTGQVSNTVANVQANIQLVVTPSVTGNDEVFLDIKPNITSVLGFTELGGNSTPNLSTRSAVTQVICKNNHTIVIGGMIKTDKSETISKVPFFGDLPGIGKLFQKKTQREVRTELIIFITPHIVSRDSNLAKRSSNQAGEFTAPRLTLQP